MIFSKSTLPVFIKNSQYTRAQQESVNSCQIPLICKEGTQASKAQSQHPQAGHVTSICVTLAYWSLGKGSGTQRLSQFIRAAVTQYHRLGELQQQKFISQFLYLGSPRSRHQGGHILVRALFLVYAPSHCLHLVEGVRALIAFTSLCFQDLITFQKPHLMVLILSCQELGFKHMIGGRGEKYSNHSRGQVLNSLLSTVGDTGSRLLSSLLLGPD